MLAQIAQRGIPTQKDKTHSEPEMPGVCAPGMKRKLSTIKPLHPGGLILCCCKPGCPRAAHMLWWMAGIPCTACSTSAAAGISESASGLAQARLPAANRSSQGMQKSEEQTLSYLTVEVWEMFCVLFSSGLTATGECGGDKAFLGT